MLRGHLRSQRNSALILIRHLISDCRAHCNCTEYNGIMHKRQMHSALIAAAPDRNGSEGNLTFRLEHSQVESFSKCIGFELVNWILITWINFGAISGVPRYLILPPFTPTHCHHRTRRVTSPFNSYLTARSSFLTVVRRTNLFHYQILHRTQQITTQLTRI
jgi:hypothetical protein